MLLQDCVLCLREYHYILFTAIVLANLHLLRFSETWKWSTPTGLASVKILCPMLRNSHSEDLVSEIQDLVSTDRLATIGGSSIYDRQDPYSAA